jgi:hypothetical protein
MKKSIVIGSALALTLSIASPALAAAPTATFTDVPANHWSYDAVSYLAKSGIIDGYSDKTFRGDKTITRYEMGQIVYKAMLNESKANIAQKALIDKLASEYALEMNKIDSIDTRLTKVENDQTVKFSGSLLEQYKVKTFEHPLTAIAGKQGWAYQQQQVRLNISAKVDNDTTIGIRLANPAPTTTTFKDATANAAGVNDDNSFKADRYFATTKTGVTKITIGRQAMDLDPAELIVDGGFFSYDGIKVTSSWNGLDFDIRDGRFAKNVTGYSFGSGVTTNATDYSNVYNQSIMIGSKVGKLNWDASLARFSNNKLSNKTLLSYTFGNLGYAFDDKFSVTTEFGKNTKATTGGTFYTIAGKYGAQSLNSTGKQNFTVQYLHAGNNSIDGIYTSFDQPLEDNNDGVNGHSWNNLDLAYRYAFSNKMVGKLEYGMIKDTVNDNASYHIWKVNILYKF